ncbi:hypothetical protein [Streptomyces sp. NBC_00878]|uniref:hypothetical protein n=1 Tax=Streptomyces sp. NBC_00878 TaxID=2975854 RepID=UPI00225980A1|nr:hypothetical protein [Streptomyces sp. NBC_00878]MCX4906866.1 hypothetical protein [Streptomyces sp. NBC_00878]
MSDPLRTDYLFGDVDCLALTEHYRCSHCNSDPATLSINSETGLPHVQVAHDSGCPVANGVLSAMPDTVRAVVGHVPETFRA